VNVLIEELMPLCTVITPNVAEAERLSGLKITDLKDAKKAAKKIHDMGANAVIVTGGHLEFTDVFFDGEVAYIEGKMINGGTHGSGCTHSAAITAELAKGTPLLEAAQRAKKFVEQAILASLKIGTGSAPVNQMGPLLEDAQRYQVLRNIEEAVEIIEENMAPELIPEVGCNIAMAVSNPSSPQDVAAVQGRIVRHKGSPHAVGCVAFGASSHIARIVLTAMRFDSSMKAAMNIRYSQETLLACENNGLEIASFSREEEPEDVTTMEWGVNEAIKWAGGRVPDVIFDAGSIGKEAMIRLLGKDALEVAARAAEITKMMVR
jgi:hydroxymethylpyrimidine/phosphomethylpyrimidine kinase